MRRRILDVTAYTTLDFADAEVRGPDWTHAATAVADVSVPDEGDAVHLDLEIDASDLELERHADRLELSPSDARALAADLEAKAASVEES